MKVVRLGIAGLLLGLALSACSHPGPTRADIAGKIRTDPRMAGSSAAVVDCLTDWYMSSASPGERKAFVDNQPGDPAVRHPPDDKMLECLKKAA